MSASRDERRVVVMCASTGGPQALEAILAALPADFPLPIYVVQHIADGFVESFAEHLATRVPLPVALAQHGAVLRPGVWIAPEGAHLRITRGRRVALDHDTVAGHHRPSADLLLESAAAALRSDAVGVVLTGMGRDGAKGAAAIAAAGGLLLAQDEASARIASMPRAAIEVGARPLAPAEIAAALGELPRNGR
jgi:two-component system, chemotaxis family, protein-glutamate methylesterase/glutaminase